MEIVIVLIAVAVLGLAAFVAAGRFGQMQPDPVRDVFQPPMPEGRLRAADIEAIRFGISPLGYDTAQVDELMARMARELDARDDEQPPQPELSNPPGDGNEDDLSAWARE